jgi:hypothetical protein
LTLRDLVTLYARDEATINEVVMTFVTSLTAVFFGQLDPIALDLAATKRLLMFPPPLGDPLLALFLQFERAQMIFFSGFISGPDERERGVWKLPPDREIVRCNSKPARLGHAPGFLPGDLVDRRW